QLFHSAPLCSAGRVWSCLGGYIGRRWEGANTGEMSHQGSQRGVKPCLTSAGSVAPLCPLYAP
ncbi:hypothetical protein KUCAC02_021204, partial [Chaenocephalus aceratus]